MQTSPLDGLKRQCAVYHCAHIVGGKRKLKIYLSLRQTIIFWEQNWSRT